MMNAQRPALHKTQIVCFSSLSLFRIYGLRFYDMVDDIFWYEGNKRYTISCPAVTVATVTENLSVEAVDGRISSCNSGGIFDWWDGTREPEERI